MGEGLTRKILFPLIINQVNSNTQSKIYWLTGSVSPFIIGCIIITIRGIVDIGDVVNI
jgi:hypothetical protein